MTVAAYAEQLWLLPRGLEELFSDWLPRLSALFGSHQRPRLQDPDGEPDGFGGLARRGAWERLVASEWAVADAVPEEFLRRVAMREQLFLRLSRVVPASAPVTRVWLDCGPTQLGAPRLAHLAILVVLRRRAQQANGELLWSTLHAPEHFESELDPKQVLKQRTTSRCEPVLTGDGERLVVGSPCRGARAIEVEETEEGLVVRFGNRRVVLALPEPREVARWLTFPTHAEIRHGNDGTCPHALRFVPGGGALLVRDDQRVYAFSMPHGKRPKTKLRHAHWENRGELAGVGWRRQRLATLRRLEDEAVFNDGARVHRMPWPIGLEPAPGLPWMTVLPRAYNGPGNHRRVALLVRDARGILHVLDFLRQTSQPIGRSRSDAWLVEGVIAWVGEDRRVRLVPSGHPPCTVSTLRDYGWVEEAEPPDDGQWFTVQEGIPYRAVRRGQKLQVARLRPWGTNPSPTDLVPEHEIVGPFQPGGASDRPLRVLVRTEHDLIVQPHGAVLVSFDVPIRHVALGGRSDPRVAVALGREVEIWNLRGERLLTFDPGACL